MHAPQLISQILVGFLMIVITILNYLMLPRSFFGNDGELVIHHIATFFKLVSDFDVVHENDLMFIFSFSLKGDAENWFNDLLKNP